MPRGDLVEGSEHPRLRLAHRLAAGEAQIADVSVAPALDEIRVLVANLRDRLAIEVTVVQLVEPLVDGRLEAERPADGGSGLARPGGGAAIEGGGPVVAERAGRGLRLAPSSLRQRVVDPALRLARGVALGLGMAQQQEADVH